MATKKQKRTAGAIRHEIALEQSKISGLKAQLNDQKLRESRHLKAEQEARGRQDAKKRFQIIQAINKDKDLK